MNTGRAPSAQHTAEDLAIFRRLNIGRVLDLVKFDRLEAFDLYLAVKVKAS